MSRRSDKAKRRKRGAAETTPTSTTRPSAIASATEPPTSALEQLVAEARAEVVPGAELSPADEARTLDAVLARAQREDAAGAPRVAPLRTRPYAGPIAFAVAAAAAVVVSLRGAPAPTSEPGPSEPGGAVASSAAPLGAARSVRGPGRATAGGRQLGPGAAPFEGEALGADDARVVFDRPGKVIWAVDGLGGKAEARARAVGETLVVTLDEGAVEADVTPVPHGEAFAVDVVGERGAVRVAVHGTHLRVGRDARGGSRVVVDLTEGVVVVGAPPRAGTTQGKLVTAPARVELDLADPVGSLVVSHDPAVVRPALALADDARAAAAAGAPSSLPHAEPGAEDVPGLVPPPGTSSAAAAPRANAKGTAAHRDATPPRTESEIVEAVRACAAGHLGTSRVAVSFASTLHLRVGASGEVEAARFEPPLDPATQQCAAGAIYKARLGAAGDLAIPVRVGP